MSRTCPAPPLLLCITLLISSMMISSSSSQHNASRRLGTLKPRSSVSDEDYENIYEDTSTTEPAHRPTRHPSCEYDHCKDQQESCQKLALALSCSCPGISGPFELPDPPSLQGLFEESKGTVIVRWCAPSSTVLRYVVVVKGQDVVRNTTVDRRMMELGYLDPGTEVCVEALNKVGSSAQRIESCAEFKPSSEKELTIKLVLIGAAVLLVIGILLMALLIWWCRRQRKSPTLTANAGRDAVL